MRSRIDPNRLNARKRHHEAVMYLLRLCANLNILHDDGQPFRLINLLFEPVQKLHYFP